MRRTLHDGPTRADIRARLQRLTPDASARWGRMSALQMLCHLNSWMDMAMGDLVIAPRRLVVRFPVVKQFVVYLMPLPKGLPTAPELLARVPAADISGDRATFHAALDRFGARDASGAWPPHPAFGPLSHRAWGVLAYRHTDHHFRQFGI